MPKNFRRLKHKSVGSGTVSSLEEGYLGEIINHLQEKLNNMVLPSFSGTGAISGGDTYIKVILRHDTIQELFQQMIVLC